METSQVSRRAEVARLEQIARATLAGIGYSQLRASIVSSAFEPGEEPGDLSWLEDAAAIDAVRVAR